MKIETIDKLYTEKRVELKSGTLVFDNYTEAKKEAEHLRSYFGMCYNNKGEFAGWYVAK